MHRDAESHGEQKCATLAEPSGAAPNQQNFTRYLTQSEWESGPLRYTLICDACIFPS
jgi:hypothetical protein